MRACLATNILLTVNQYFYIGKEKRKQTTRERKSKCICVYAHSTQLFSMPGVNTCKAEFFSVTICIWLLYNVGKKYQRKLGAALLHLSAAVEFFCDYIPDSENWNSGSNFHPVAWKIKHLVDRCAQTCVVEQSSSFHGNCMALKTKCTCHLCF